MIGVFLGIWMEEVYRNNKIVYILVCLSFVDSFLCYCKY